MEIDTDRVDGAVLALLRLGLHDARRRWKGRAERLFAELFAVRG